MRRAAVSIDVPKIAIEIHIVNSEDRLCRMIQPLDAEDVGERQSATPGSKDHSRLSTLQPMLVALIAAIAAVLSALITARVI
jgi:hypothetical protein